MLTIIQYIRNIKDKKTGKSFPVRCGETRSDGAKISSDVGEYHSVSEMLPNGTSYFIEWRH